MNETELCKHEKIEYLEWKILEDRGSVVGNCPCCESTVTMKQGMILGYKDWEFTYEEASKLIDHLMSNLKILDTLQAEITAFYEEGLISKKEMSLEIAMLHCPRWD